MIPDSSKENRGHIPSIRVSFFFGDSLDLDQTLEGHVHEMGAAEYKTGLYGSGGGSFLVKYTKWFDPDPTEYFLDSLDRFSHFIVIEEDDEIVASGIVESCINAEDFEGYRKVSFVGFKEYLDSITLYSAFKQGEFSRVARVAQDDTSWSKLFYANNPMRLLQAILLELRSNMVYEGYTPFFDITSFGSDESADEWNEKFELNSLEFPSLGDVFTEIVENPNCDHLNIETVIYNNQVRFYLEFVPFSWVDRLFADTYEGIGDLTFEDPISSKSSHSVLKSDEINGITYVSRIPYAYGTTAYSTFIPEDSSTVANLTLSQQNDLAVRKEENLAGVMTWKTFDKYSAEVGVIYEMYIGDIIAAFVTESSYSLQEGVYSVSATLLSDADGEKAYRAPGVAYDSTLTRALKNPLDRSEKNSIKAIRGSRRNPTGKR